MLSKDSKIRILEGFYGLDYIFFDKPITSMKIDTSIAENYLVLKSALSNVIIEMFKLVDHSATINETVDADWIHEHAKRDALASKKICKKLVVTEDGRMDVKNQIRELIEENENILESKSISEIVQEEVERKSYSLAVDTLLIAKMLKECKNYKALNEAEGMLLESSYKIIRDSIIETARFINSVN